MYIKITASDLKSQYFTCCDNVQNVNGFLRKEKSVQLLEKNTINTYSGFTVKI